MGTRDSYTIIAAIDKVDYPAIKELLLKHEIDSEIKPAFEEENGEPHGPMVDLYVHYLVASQAIKLLTKYKLLPREGDDWGWFTPLVETKAALFIVYTIITLGLIWAIVWAATQAVHGNFISTP
ncbi:MAG: hypothetical protein M0D57_02710 [Sphingobacteriales bacterium JAD_PAG50586_3]|nr:MAG: hypothetical protein M0D57_02710 [Sphingobacteriales bacterium JAD_PAG50586_3]